jgi:hypothetical protein
MAVTFTACGAQHGSSLFKPCFRRERIDLVLAESPKKSGHWLNVIDENERMRFEDIPVGDGCVHLQDFMA